MQYRMNSWIRFSNYKTASGQVEWVYQLLINKSKGFSQSLSRVLAGGDIIWQKPNISR
jgi:hypothetical protein